MFSLNSLEDVKEANLNFSMGTLMVELVDYKDIEEVKEEITDVVHSFEPKVKVEPYSNLNKSMCTSDSCNCNSHDHGHEHEESNKLTLIVGTVAFIAGLVLKDKDLWGLALFIISYILIGGSVVISALKNIIKGRVFDENFLMTVATIGAFAIGEYPEAVAVMLFYQIGELFQGYAVNKSRKSISSLMNIRADYANLLVNNIEKKVSPEEVYINDIIVIKPGERVPLDGILVDGSTTVDTSALTGESVPRNIKVNEEILSGCINLSGVIKVKVTKVFGQSTVSRILELVENANSKKAPTEKFITKFSRVYTPIVVLLAVVVAIVPPLVIDGANFSEWIYRALVFLVVSCPCALVVSVPLAIFAGIGAASKKGVLIKGGNYLEALKDVDTIVFDKTGTLTEGIFAVTKVKNIDISKDELLKLAAYSESFSNHPIAKSIIESYGKDIDKTLIKDYKEISGHGISVKVENKNILLGNYKLMKNNKISFIEANDIGTIIHLAIDNKYCGYIVISDKVKEGAKNTISSLKSIGIKQTVMLTGDNKKVADAIADDLGLDKVYSELLPQDKVNEIEKIYEGRSIKEKVAFVGDGINDAPVLARVDVGIAMGGIGSDAAIEAADVVLMKDNPESIIDSVRIAKRTNKILWQNIIFSLGIKILVLILGAFGMANIWEGVFADVGVTLIAVINSMRALKIK